METEEDPQCGLLRKSLDSTRDVAQNWGCEHGGFREETGLRRVA